MIYRFDRFTLDGDRFLLSRDGEPVHLEPRVLELLCYLVANRERVLGKTELLAEVWRQEFLTDAVLSQSMYELRRALDDDPRSPRIVKTVRGRGYVFVAAVTAEETGNPVAVEPVPVGPSGAVARPRRRRWWAVVAAAAALVAAAFILLGGRPVGGESVRGVAILPLVNATGDDSLQWVELGLTDMIGRGLIASGLDVVPLAQVMTARRNLGLGAEDVPSRDQVERLASVVGARWVVTGAVTRDVSVLQLRATLHSLDRSPRTTVLSAGEPLGLGSGLAAFIAARAGAADPPRGLAGRFGDGIVATENLARGLQELERGNLREARRYLEACLEEDPDAVEASLELAVVLRKLGEVDASLALGEALIARARSTDDRALEAGALNNLGIIEWSRGDLESAAARFERAALLNRSAGAVRREAAAWVNLGIVAAQRGQRASAAAHYDRALELYRRVGDRRGEASVFNSYGTLAWSAGNVAHSGEMHERALAIRREIGDRHNEAASLNNLGTVAMARGEVDRAEALYEQSLAIRRELEDRAGTASTLANLGQLAVERGDLKTAERRLAEALAAFEDLGRRVEQARVLRNLAEVAEARGRLDEAATVLSSATERCREAGDPFCEGQSRASLAVIEAARGSIDRAAQHASAAVELGERADSPYLRSYSGWARARVELARGDRTTARGLLRASLDEARAAGEPQLESEALLALTRLELEVGDTSGARSWLRAIPSSRAGSFRHLDVEARVLEAEGDHAAATRTAEAARIAAGERWTEADEARLEGYRSSASAPARD